MDTAPLLEVSHLFRAFESVKAVNDISFKLYPGQVVGLIGANGAGKTTTMRMLATLDIPDSGEILLNGTSIIDQPEKARAIIGWMPDDFAPYKYTDIAEYLDFFGRSYGFKGDELDKAVSNVIEFTELTDLRNRLINKLSKGQTQRLCLARSLISNPSLLILDEPAAGLDPKARLEFKNLVRILKDSGKTLLISSHILSELAEMCDSLIFMDAGTIVHDGDTNELLSHGTKTESCLFELQTAGPIDQLELWLINHPGWTITEMRKDTIVAEFHSVNHDDIAGELRRMVEDIPISEFHRTSRKLEDAFIDMLRDIQLHPTPNP